MAAVTGAALITAGSAAYGASQQRRAAREASRGADAATEEQRRQFDLAREDTAPWRDVGRSALNQLASLYGLQQSGGADPAAPGQPDFSAFYESPDYQFARAEGLRGIERSAAARGGLASGNTLADLTRFSSGLATQNFGSYVNRLAGLAGTGQASAEGLAGQRMNLGQQIGQNAIGAAGARASGIAGAANQWTNAAGQFAGFLGYGGGNQFLRPRAIGGVGAGMGMPPGRMTFPPWLPGGPMNA